jgi:hypothetical protein
MRHPVLLSTCRLVDDRCVRRASVVRERNPAGALALIQVPVSRRMDQPVSVTVPDSPLPGGHPKPANDRRFSLERGGMAIRTHQRKLAAARLCRCWESESLDRSADERRSIW